MRARPGDVLRVGILGTLALVIFFGSAFWLRSFLQLRRGTWFIVEFHRAMGLEEGSNVFVQGIRAGTVERVHLRPPATVHVFIRLEKPIPVYHNSRITVRMGTLIGQPHVDIINPPEGGRKIREGEILRGIDPISWEELIPQVGDIAEGIRAIVGDPKVQKDLVSALADLAVAARKLRDLLVSIPPKEVRALTENLRALSDRLNRLAYDPKLHAIVDHMETTTRALADLLGKPQIREGLPKMVEETYQIVHRLHDLIADETLHRDLKALIKNLRLSSDAIRRMLSPKGSAGELHALLTETRQTVTALRKIVANPGVQRSLEATLKNMEALSLEGQKTVAQLNASLKELQGLLSDLRSQWLQVGKHLQGITKDLDETLDVLKWVMVEGGFKENIKKVGENLRLTTEDLRATTETVRQLVTDPKTQASLREGLQAVGPTLRAMEVTMKRLARLTRIRGGMEGRLWFLPGREEVRGEGFLRLEVPASPASLLLGTYADRQGTRWNLQIQGELGEFGLWRFGVVRSKLGFGLGWAGERFGVEVEAFDPRDWRVNTWLWWHLSPSLALRLGIEDIRSSKDFSFGVLLGRGVTRP